MRRSASFFFRTDAVCAVLLLLHCCTVSITFGADLPCPPHNFNNWSVNTSYVLQNCCQGLSVFNVSLPSQPASSELYYGNIGITVIGGCLLPRIIITSNTDTMTAGNISVVLRNVNLHLNVPSASSESGTVLGTAGQRLGGMLMCIVAQSWHNISLSIIDSNIAVIGPGWLFNWDSSVRYRISALLSLSSTGSSGTATTSSEGLTVIVCNSTLNISEVAGVSVMFLVDHASAPTVPLRNLYLRIDSTSTVAFSTYNSASMCNGNFTYQLSSQAIFLVEGPGSGAQLTNVNCLVEASRIIIWYVANSKCGGSDRHTESGVAIVRSFSMVQQVAFVLNLATSVTVRMYMAPNGDVEYASRAMVFGITSGGVAQNIKGIANCSDGSRADVRGSDFASLFMFNALSSVAYSTITIANMDVMIVTTALSTSSGRTSSALLLELVDLLQHSLVTISSLNASVSALPGNDTALLAVASSLFYLKGGMLNASVEILQCVMYGSNTDGSCSTSFLMISVAAVLVLAWLPSYNITDAHILLSNVRLNASVAYSQSSTNPMSMSLSSASIGLICAPMVVTSSGFFVNNCTVTSVGTILGALVKRSVASAVLSSVPLPPSGTLKQFVSGLDTIFSSIQNSIYTNVTVIIQCTSLVAASAINEGGFEGTAVFILPLVLSDGSNVTIHNCSSLEATKLTTKVDSATFFSSTLLAAVANTAINGSSYLEASDCIKFAHSFVAIQGDTKVASNVTIVMKRVALEAQRYSAVGSLISSAPIVAQPTIIFPSQIQTSLTFDACSSITFESSAMSGFTALSTSVTFASTTASCAGIFLVLSCCHWIGTEVDASSSLIYSPLMPALKGIPSVAIHNDEHCDASHTMSHSRPPADRSGNAVPSQPPTSQESLTIAGGASSIAASVSLVLSASFSGGVAAADFQVLALLGLSPCAPSNLQSSTSISKYIVVSPFYDLGDEAQILGNIGLILFVVVLQITSQYVLPDQQVTVASSSPQTTWGNIVSHLQRFPRYSVMLGIVLIPGVWRSALSILVSGGGSEGAVSQGNIGARLTIGVFGCASVVGAALWRWRESSLLDRCCAARGGAKVTSLTFYKYHERVFRKHSVFMKVPRWMLPCGFWGPQARRLTHGPLRNVIRGGVDASTAVLHMSAYPVVVTVLVATAISIPHADNANQSLCIASWALVSVNGGDDHSAWALSTLRRHVRVTDVCHNYFNHYRRCAVVERFRRNGRNRHHHQCSVAHLFSAR
ncbi:Hypothetical protein, putative [Bodo saltans]|uniref:Membrane-associated protein n=1 Tax=Bodo saltans TaxID=75058 RepID=A0A0S4JUX1_BODSA|nr:Hypothetical protein, putative [Bodo saltans]|eukprot:CUG93183.1 Hypothetical protein, putative [Bodo saltans]